MIHAEPQKHGGEVLVMKSEIHIAHSNSSNIVMAGQVPATHGRGPTWSSQTAVMGPRDLPGDDVF